MILKNHRFGLAVIAVLTALVGAASFSAAHAEPFAGDVPTLVWIDAGWSANDINTGVALLGKNGVGATIDFEEIFDMDPHRSTARMFGTARISKERRYIDFGYVAINRSGSRVIDDEIEWGDNIIDAGADLTAKFNTGFIYAAFRYDFLHLEPVHISGSAGLTWLELSAGLEGNGTYTPINADGSLGTPVTGSFNREGSQGAPVPMVGLNLDWALARRLVVRGYTRFFRINVSAFDGGLYESGVRLNWYFVKNFGLGVGFDRTDLKINELKVGNGDIVKANYGFSGFALFITLAF